MVSAVRVVKNRATFDAITLGLADGLEALAEAVIAATKPPRDQHPEANDVLPPLYTTGGTVAYVLGKQVGGTGGVTKPRAMKVKSLGVAVAGGFGFPGHFAEFGTIHEPARPFLTPPFMATIPGAEGFVAAAMAHRLGTTAQRAATGAKIEARAAAKAAGG